MRRDCLKWLIFAGVLVPWPASAQQTCVTGILIVGAITDPSGAVIRGAQVQTASGQRTISDATGSYALPCIAGTSAVITAQADGFGQKMARAQAHLGATVRVDFQLEVAAVETDVHVQEDPTSMDGEHGMSTITLDTQQVQQLADDPDDFLRELQALASISGGGNPSSTIVRVDGFQNGSALPLKSSIASIREAPSASPISFLCRPSGVVVSIGRAGCSPIPSPTTSP